jgi:uncharacterized protein YggE
MLFPIRALIFAGALASLEATAAAQARPDRPEPPQVRTAATVQRSVQPDLATVTLQFTGDGGNPAQAGRRLAGRADSLRRALAALGIPRDSLVNRSRWNWWQGRIETIPGAIKYVTRAKPGPDGRSQDPVQDTTYRAHDAIEVRIRDLSKVGAVLDAAMGRGITDISAVNFTASDITALQYEALREATVRARRQAEAIAAASSLQLGRVLSLSTENDYSERFRPYDFALSGGLGAEGAATPAGGSPTVVVQPSIPVSVTVYGRWELVARQR